MANKTYVEARKHFQLDSHLPSFQASCVGVSSDILLHRVCICRQYLNSSAEFFFLPQGTEVSLQNSNKSFNLNKQKRMV